MMYSSERDLVILNLLAADGFASFGELTKKLPVSPATLQRDLARLQSTGKIVREHGGVRLTSASNHSATNLLGKPFQAGVRCVPTEVVAIGRAGAALCRPGDAVIIDGGSTTLQMCPHLEPLGLQVLTNSLPIAGVLLRQPHTRVVVPGGTIFREQNIIMNPFEDVAPRNFHASRMFMSCAAISRFGLMQSDIILVQAQRQLLTLADELVVLADSSKFSASAGHLVCGLSCVTTLITDSALAPAYEEMIRRNGVALIKCQD